MTKLLLRESSAGAGPCFESAIVAVNHLPAGSKLPVTVTVRLGCAATTCWCPLGCRAGPGGTLTACLIHLVYLCHTAAGAHGHTHNCTPYTAPVHGQTATSNRQCLLVQPINCTTLHWAASGHLLTAHSCTQSSRLQQASVRLSRPSFTSGLPQRVGMAYTLGPAQDTRMQMMHRCCTNMSML